MIKRLVKAISKLLALIHSISLIMPWRTNDLFTGISRQSTSQGRIHQLSYTRIAYSVRTVSKIYIKMCLTNSIMTCMASILFFLRAGSLNVREKD